MWGMWGRTYTNENTRNPDVILAATIRSQSCPSPTMGLEAAVDAGKSELPRSKVRSLQTFSENQYAAQQMRWQAEEYKWRRSQNQDDVVRRTQALRAKGINRAAAIKSAQETLRQQNARAVQQVKAETRAAQRRENQRREELDKQALSMAQQERVMAQERALSAQADSSFAFECQSPDLAAGDGAAASSSWSADYSASPSPIKSADLTIAAAHVRGKVIAKNRDQATAVRESTRAGVAAGFEAVALEHATMGHALRGEAQEGRQLRQETEDEYLSRARQIKEERAAARAKLRANSLELQRRRQRKAEEIRRQRAEEEPVQESLAKWGNNFLKERAHVEHERRFASTEDAQAYDTSSLHHVRTPRWVQRAKESMLGLWAPSRANEDAYTSYGAGGMMGRSTR